MITLLDYFSWQGPNTSSMVTPWVSFPSDYKEAELWVDIKTTDANTVTLDLQSSPDTTAVETSGSFSVGGSVGVTANDVTSKLGPMVRLKLSTSGTAATVTLSVWLIPKRD